MTAWNDAPLFRGVDVAGSVIYREFGLQRASAAEVKHKWELRGGEVRKHQGPRRLRCGADKDSRFGDTKLKKGVI